MASIQCVWSWLKVQETMLINLYLLKYFVIPSFQLESLVKRRTGWEGLVLGGGTDDCFGGRHTLATYWRGWGWGGISGCVFTKHSQRHSQRIGWGFLWGGILPEYYLSLGKGICTSRLQSGLTGAHQKKEWKGTFYPEDQVLSEGRLTIGSTAGPHHHDITTVSGGGVGGQEGEGEGLWWKRANIWSQLLCPIQTSCSPSWLVLYFDVRLKIVGPIFCTDIQGVLWNHPIPQFL